MEHRGRGYSQCPGRVPDPGGQAGVQSGPGFGQVGALAAGVQQPERGGRLGHVGEQLREVPFVVVRGDAEPGLGDEVAERHRAGQGGGVPGQDGADLAEQDFQAQVVLDQVMDLHQRRPPARPGHRRHIHPHQWRPPQIQPRPGRQQLFHHVVPGDGDVTNRHLGLPPDHLDRLGQPFPGQRGPVYLMPVVPGLNPQHHRRDVHIAAAPAHQVVEEHPLLQRGQRVDIGDVGRAAADQRGDPVDVVLAQLDQRQHGRGDPRRPVRHRPRRHRHRQHLRRGQPGRGRGGEEGADGDGDPAFA